MSLPVLSVLSCVCMCCPIVVYNFCVMARWINAYLAITSQCLSLISELSLLQEVGGFFCVVEAGVKIVVIFISMYFN